MTEARKAAYNALMRVERDGAYSSLALGGELSQLSDERDRSLASAIVYGVLENRQLLDMQIEEQTGRKVRKLQDSVLTILRMAIFQLAFMDRIPESAAVNEAVTMAKKKAAQASGFVNAVLRSFVRVGKKITLPDREKSPVLWMSARYSCPMWLIELWQTSYGQERCEKILQTLEGRAPVFIRVNTTRTDADKLKQMLENEGVKVNSITHDGALEIDYTGAVDELDSYREGLFHVQDLASQLCAAVLEPAEQDTVIDVCAAPGGKSFTLSEMMNGNGRIIACDLYQHRVGLIADGAKRLGLSNIETMVRDASVGDSLQADKVLCDVPCSGLGVIRRKPDIMFKAPADLLDLQSVQREILTASSTLVKSGGTLLYSTCTLNPSENEENIRWFLSHNSCFELLPVELPEWVDCTVTDAGTTIFPSRNGSDGFFIARLKRKD